MRAEIVSRVFHPVPDDQRKLLTVSRHNIRGVEADISAMPPTSIIPAMNPAAEIAAIGLQPAMR
jgi:hypothetical protein